MTTQDNMPLASSLSKELQDVVMLVKWRNLAQEYFDRPSEWIYNKLHGREEGEGGFTPEEQQQLKGALCDMADRLRKAADSIG